MIEDTRRLEGLVHHAKHFCFKAGNEAEVRCMTGLANDLTQIWAELCRVEEDLLLGRQTRLNLSA